MKKILLLFSVFLLTLQAFAQDKATISGYIKDAANGEGLIGVSVYVQELKTGTSTNAYGFYSLSLPKGAYSLVISYVSFEKIIKKVNLSEGNVKADIEMKGEDKLLQEIIIKSRKDDDNVKSLEMSVNKVEMSTIKKMPALFGEVDLVKSIQFLPGVSSVGEGASGFNVRGGAIDQNLVLLDEAPVYNSSHLFGFFSIFNPDAVKDVKLIKGGIPANYGGRISSILDVRMKEGNSKKLSFSGGVGSIFSRFAIEGPLFKQKGSFIVAARRSYIDFLAKPFLKGDLKESKFFFYDLTAKANYKLNSKNTLFLSGYFGRDVFATNFGFNWGNATTTFRWNHIFSDKLFLNTTLFYSNYDYALQTGLLRENNQDSFKWSSNILNYSIKPDFTYYINPNNTLSFGGQSTYYNFKPGEAVGVSGGETRVFGYKDKFASESAAYLANEQKFSSNFSLQYGIRYSFYQYLGKGTALQLGTPTGKDERRKILGTTDYAQGDAIQEYGNWEPRFALNLNISPNSSIKASYNRLAQYIHLLSNTTASSPLDVWTPSSNNIKPQIADQVALGYFKNFDDNMYETSIEIYYKNLQNQVDYITGAQLLLNPNSEADLLFGKGRAYGAEFFFKKNKGKLNGWISYTLSRTEKLVEGLNNNSWFPARIDKTHNLSVVAIYDYNKRWTFSANFTYSTGTPASFPTDKFVIQGNAIGNNYDNARNSYRIPNSHRLDISATKVTRRKLFGMNGEVVYSIYNVYNRRNPFSEYVRQSADDPTKTEAVNYSVFGSFLPAVTYNFKF
jgi:hypothetical protein